MSCQFYSENKNQLHFLSVLYLCIVLIIVIIYVLIRSYIQEFITDTTASITIGILVFALFFGYLNTFVIWSSIRKLKNRNLGAFPFNQIKGLGFDKVERNRDSKWKMTETLYCGKIHGFRVECNVESTYFEEYVLFIFKNKGRDVTTKEHELIRKELEVNRGYWDYNGIKRKFHYKNHNMKSLNTLKNKLEDFAILIQKLGFVAD